MKKSKKPTTRNVFVGLVLFFILSTLVILAIFTRQLTAINQRIDTLSFELALAKNEVAYQHTLLQPSLIVDKDMLAFPELRIAIPYDNVSKTLRYHFDTYENNIQVTSTLLGEQPTLSQLSCEVLVRVNTHNGTPYSPWEQSAGEVKLADGRTLYIIKAVSFENHEASNTYCPATAWTQITPDQVAEVFKAAQSY